MKDFSVLGWERSDLAEIAELEKKCFDDPWSEEMLSASFSDENFFKLDCVVVNAGGICYNKLRQNGRDVTEI